jgi:hypothetical protein
VAVAENVLICCYQRRTELRSLLVSNTRLHDWCNDFNNSSWLSGVFPCLMSPPTKLLPETTVYFCMRKLTSLPNGDYILPLPLSVWHKVTGACACCSASDPGPSAIRLTLTTYLHTFPKPNRASTPPHHRVSSRGTRNVSCSGRLVLRTCY